jgi:apolipoprotein N-acyltransferase
MRIGTAPPDIVQTPMAKIAGVICYDTEFVSFTRAVARAGADILFAPSNDWPQIAIMRAAVTRYRALETGMALVRPTRNGVSEIISADGRVLAQSPYDPNTGTVLVADIDARAIPTVYTQGGDWPGGAALLLLIILFGWAMQRGRHLAARHRAL